MWLAKPLYELLPVYYIILGVLGLVVAVFVDYWYWAPICATAGFLGLVGGLVVLLKRRDYRASRSRLDFDETR
jgi:Flp pilus assembly protein TadB